MARLYTYAIGVGSLGGASDVSALIASTALDLGVDPSLAIAVARQESGFNQAAIGNRGEIGVFQLMPATARDLGVNPSDLSQNIRGGVRYLRQMLSRFGGDPALALAGYNAGATRVSNAIAAGGGNWFDRIPTSTQAYVTTILAAIGQAIPVSGGYPSPPEGEIVDPGASWSEEFGMWEVPDASSAIPVLLALATGVAAVWILR